MLIFSAGTTVTWRRLGSFFFYLRKTQSLCLAALDFVLYKIISSERRESKNYGVNYENNYELAPDRFSRSHNTQ
jgi:hypothetical protein